MLAINLVDQWPVGGLAAAFIAMMKMVLRLTSDQRRAEQTLRHAEAALRTEFGAERTRIRDEASAERERIREECARDRAGDRVRIEALEARVRELEAPRRRTT